MTVVINGTTGIASSGGDTSTSLTTTTLVATTVNGLTVGKGAGSVSTNTAVGASALAANTSGALSTAVGISSLAANTTGVRNSAIGGYSLTSNTSGGYNVAHGYEALAYNTTASNNTAVGYHAGYTNTTGTANTFIGYAAGYTSNSTASGYNVAIGRQAGYSLTTGDLNTFIGGSNSGYYVTIGAKNTVVGNFNGNQNGLDIRTASNYIVLSDGDGNPRAYFNSTGRPYIQAVYDQTTASAANVNVGSFGELLRSTSALKYKQDIRDLEEMDISLLRAVRYKSKCENDDQTKDHLGLIADEAAEAGYEELVTRGADGEVEGFQYERLTVVLLKKLQTLDAEFKAYVAAHP